MPGAPLHVVPIWKTAPFIRLLIPLCAGIILSRFIPFSRIQLQFGFILSAILLGFFYFKALRFPTWYGVSQAIFWIIFGATLYLLNRAENKETFIGNKYREGALIAATLISTPEPKPKSWKVEADIRQWDSAANRWVLLSGGAILYLERGSVQKSLPAGSVLAFRKNLQPVKSSGNPGSFDFSTFASDKGLFFQVFLRSNEYIISEKSERSLWKTWPHTARDFLLSTLRKYVKGDRAIGVAEALLTGYRGDMDKELSWQYAGTGAAHIIAISGLHLVMIQQALFFIFVPITRFRHGKNIRAGFVIIFLWVFAIITGAGASVLRAALMLTILSSGEVIGRKGNSYNSLAASAFLLLLYNPNLLFDIGFQLSYSAVLSIFIFNAPIQHLVQTNNYLLHKAWEMFAVTLSAQVLTLPFVVYYFHQFPVYFLLANLAAIPLSWVALNLMLILTLVLWWAGPVAAWLGRLIDISIQAMNESIALINGLPMSRIENIYLPLPQAILMMAIIGWGAAWLLLRRNSAAVVALLGLAVFILYREWVWQQNKQQRNLVVYNISSHWAIEMIDGHTSLYAGDAECLEDPDIFRNQIQPARIRFQVDSTGILPVAAEGFTVVEIGGKKLLILDKEPDLFHSDTIHTDLLLLAANIRAKPARILEKIRCRTIIFTGKMPFYRLPQWQIAADSLHLRLHSVADHGAFILDLNGPGP